MLLNLLADQFREVGIGEAALYALLGYLIVFLGIAFLIFVVWLVGRIISSKQQAPAPVKKQTAQEVVAVADAAPVTDEIDEETLAVITAALMAYYQTNNPKCEFTVKRIKRL